MKKMMVVAIGVVMALIGAMSPAAASDPDGAQGYVQTVDGTYGGQSYDSLAAMGTLCNLTGVCGKIKHYTPDGYCNGCYFLIRCKFGDPDSNHALYEGETSTKYCHDTDQVHVRDGESLWCKYPTGPDYDPWADWVWIANFPYGPKWWKIADNERFGAGCTVRQGEVH